MSHYHSPFLPQTMCIIISNRTLSRRYQLRNDIQFCPADSSSLCLDDNNCYTSRLKFYPANAAQNNNNNNNNNNNTNNNNNSNKRGVCSTINVVGTNGEDSPHCTS